MDLNSKNKKNKSYHKLQLCGLWLCGLDVLSMYEKILYYYIIFSPNVKLYIELKYILADFLTYIAFFSFDILIIYLDKKAFSKYCFQILLLLSPSIWSFFRFWGCTLNVGPHICSASTLSATELEPKHLLEKESSVFQAGLESVIQLRMASNFWPSCFHLPSTRIAGHAHCLKYGWVSNTGLPVLGRCSATKLYSSS